MSSGCGGGSDLRTLHGRALSGVVLAGCVPVDAQLPGIGRMDGPRSLVAVPPSTLRSVTVVGFLRGGAVGLRTLPLSSRVASSVASTPEGPEGQRHPSSTAPVRRAPSYAHLRLYRASRPLGITKSNPEEQVQAGGALPQVRRYRSGANRLVYASAEHSEIDEERLGNIRPVGVN